jgi:hypothetical protein
MDVHGFVAHLTMFHGLRMHQIVFAMFRCACLCCLQGAGGWWRLRIALAIDDSLKLRIAYAQNKMAVMQRKLRQQSQRVKNP